LDKGSDFQYNSLQYKVAHPSISKDGSILVFDFGMLVGKGVIDLYICIKQGKAGSQPQNLSSLNTTENELFPIFNDKGNLLFSSNGLPGLGGLMCL
jgi:Tol biopolymer transport system component